MTDFTDPLGVFRAAVETLNAEDWAAATALVDPVSLLVFVRQLRERVAPSDPRNLVTAEEYMRGNPALPRAVAEYYEAEARRHADPATRLEQELPGVQSLLELHTLAADELFRHWLAGRSARRQVERLAVDGHISHRTAEIRASRDFRMYRYVVIGVLPDGDELAHVLYRHDVDSEKPLSGGAASWLANLPDDEQLLARQLWASGHPSVALFRRQPDGSWRLIVEHDFLQIGSIQITGVIVDDKPKDGEEQ